MAARPIRSGPTSWPAPNQWAQITGQTVNTSFHNGDVPSQQEAIRAAIAAKADAIVTTSPDPGSLVEVVKEARAAGIPVINFNTPDPAVDFNAYVGADLIGRRQGLGAVSWSTRAGLKKGDFVWMPVEVPGASYGVEEEKGIASSVRAARHHLGSHRDHARPGRSHHPHERLPHRQPRQDQGASSGSATWRPAASSGCSTRSASSRAKSRSSAGATRSTPPRKCSTATSTPRSGRIRRRPATWRCRWR